MRCVSIFLVLALLGGVAHADLDSAKTDARRARLFSDELLLHLEVMRRRRVQKKRTARWLTELHEVRSSLDTIDAWIREHPERKKKIESLAQGLRALEYQLFAVERKEKLMVREIVLWTAETARKRAALHKEAADHNARPPGKGASEAEVERYNREAVKGNARGEAFEKKVEAEQAAFRNREDRLQRERKTLRAQQEELQARKQHHETEHDTRARMIPKALGPKQALESETPLRAASIVAPGGAFSSFE